MRTRSPDSPTAAPGGTSGAGVAVGSVDNTPSPSMWSYRKTWYGVALLVRAVLLAYGTWQDENMVVKYTDIDYFVYSDAAKAMYHGGSPYDRATYRYTPLLANLLLPNLYLTPHFGKILFATFDIVLALLLESSIRSMGVQRETAFKYTCTWLFNPVAINVSTRGSSEALVGCLVVSTLILVMRERPIAAGVALGFAVHLKLYPILFSLPLYLYMDNVNVAPLKHVWAFRRFFSVKKLLFAVSTVVTFVSLLVFYYERYGDTFLYETYLYHFIRVDHRHNFSVYFYLLLLSTANPTQWLGLVVFLPQLVVTLGSSLLLYKYPPFCLFFQTVAFVAFNKVVTAQYFIWYMSLFPLLLPHTSMPLRWEGLGLLLFWFVGDAYRIEFLGENVFLQVWMAGIVFFVAHVLILIRFVCRHSFASPVQVVTEKKQ